jgi:hypothetical protein
VLLNDPQFVESARRLAENILLKDSAEDTRAETMLQTVLSHPAHVADLEDVEAAVAEFRDLFQQNPEAAKELINTGDTSPNESLDAVELATWTLVANTLMNRDDFVNK